MGRIGRMGLALGLLALAPSGLTGLAPLPVFAESTPTAISLQLPCVSVGFFDASAERE